MLSRTPDIIMKECSIKHIKCTSNITEKKHQIKFKLIKPSKSNPKQFHNSVLNAQINLKNYNGEN